MLEGRPTDLWDALVFNVIGQPPSVAATRAILARLRAVHDGRLPTPAEQLATDTEALRRAGLSRAKTVFLRGVLMLALRRPDIWPAADLALRRAVERVWELNAPASLADIDAIGDRFRPWRTLAALDLYRSGRREAKSVSSRYEPGRERSRALVSANSPIVQSRSRNPVVPSLR